MSSKKNNCLFDFYILNLLSLMVLFSEQLLFCFKSLLSSCLLCIITHSEYHRRYSITNTGSVLFCCRLKRFLNHKKSVACACMIRKFLRSYCKLQSYSTRLFVNANHRRPTQKERYVDQNYLWT